MYGMCSCIHICVISDGIDRHTYAHAHTQAYTHMYTHTQNNLSFENSAVDEVLAA